MGKDTNGGVGGEQRQGEPPAPPTAEPRIRQFPPPRGASQQGVKEGLLWTWGRAPPARALLPVLLEGQSHVLLHLLEAMVVGVDEVERQGHGERAVPPAWRHP